MAGMWSMIKSPFLGEGSDAADTYNRGVIKLGSGDWTAAAENFAAAATHNHPSAVFNLALINLMGRTEQLEIDKGFSLMEMSASLGHKEAAQWVAFHSQYEFGFRAGESVTAMIALSEQRCSDVLLIRVLARSLFDSLEGENNSDLSAYYFHEVAAFIKAGGAARQFLRESEISSDRPSGVLVEELESSADTHGARCSALNDQLMQSLAEVHGYSKPRLDFIRCSVLAIIFDHAFPDLSDGLARGLGFYENPEWFKLEGIPMPTKTWASST